MIDRMQTITDSNAKRGEIEREVGWGRIESNHAVALPGLEGELLLGHGVGEDLRERVRGAAERGVHRPIHLVEVRRV